MPPNPFSPGRIAALTETVRAHTREQVITITRERTAANQGAIRAHFGHDAPVTRYVDGQKNKPLEQVNANGYTLTVFELSEGVVDAAIRALIEASPLGPPEHGHYRDDHWTLVVSRSLQRTPAISVH